VRVTDDRAEIENLRCRRLPRREGHPLRVGEQHPRIDAIGLGALHQGATEVAHRSGVENAHLDARRAMKREREIEVIDPRRLEADPSVRLASRQKAHQPRVPFDIVCERQPLRFPCDRYHDLVRAHVNPDTSPPVHLSPPC
jgi:hypothetical protein